MVHKMVTLEFFFASPRQHDFLDRMIETSKCFECKCEAFRLRAPDLVESHNDELQ